MLVGFGKGSLGCPASGAVDTRVRGLASSFFVPVPVFKGVLQEVETS